ncbi:hypothetical protein QBC38DRAFT_540970 [Podospora fimiseda]|uniref:Calponin-homology (CH) domain-containing protein n=1 Tax=Podospora fimiseda TaxID=252190 RepID=A0AAN7BYX6_9PEZI|nr:hypothetical protein QBC38DRAFT_540970 [Podospora fimiseda]
MASVTSLDGDLRKLRLEKYTPAAANEAKQWIESILNERLPAGDLLDALKDGVALCKLVNLIVGPPGVKFKKSAMPFVQMENISHFLRASQGPPLNLQQHDMFLTVDLFEKKDPAQVLQCIGAFSRAANNVNPDSFPTAMGPKSKPVLSPQATGYNSGYNTPPGIRGRGNSNASSTASSLAPKSIAIPPSTTSSSVSDRWGAKSPTPTPASANGRLSPGVSTWSKREHEGATSPAWNIAQYGYLGGATQGNLGIVYGGRRQITSAGPYVPSLAEKEKKRKEEAERLQREKEEEEKRKQAEREAEEERARLEEERRWEEETKRIKEEERKKLEEEKRRWEEEERQWKIAEERRRKEEEEAEARLQNARSHKSDNKLRGQYLSQYQSEQEASDKERIRQLEMELEKARQREAEYERERQSRSRAGDRRNKGRSRSRSRPAAKKEEQTVSRQDSWSVRDEQNFHSTAWYQREQDIQEEDLPVSPRPLPDPLKAQRTGDRQVKSPRSPPPASAPFIIKQRTGSGGLRPLPEPVKSHRTGEKLAPQIPIKPQRTGEKLGPQLPIKPQRTGTGEKLAPQLPIKPQRTGEKLAAPQIPIKPQRTGENLAPQLPIKPQRTGERIASSPFLQKQRDGSAGLLRPLPEPKSKPQPSRTDRFLSSNPAPPQTTPKPTFARELGGSIDERAEEDRRRAASQVKTKAAGWASKSLLEREMEMERQRQREWEEAQKETTSSVVTKGGQVDGIGGRWDVSQWGGYTGGDGQNKGGQGIGAGRRQIVGPRPLPGAGRIERILFCFFQFDILLYGFLYLVFAEFGFKSDEELRDDGGHLILGPLLPQNRSF